MFVHKNHAAGGGNGSIIVGMFVFLCLASQKRSERDFFVPARTDLGVKLLNIYQIGYWKTIKCNDLRVLAHRGLHHTKPYKAWVQKNTYCCHYRARQLLSFAKFLSFSKPFFSYFRYRRSDRPFLYQSLCVCLLHYPIVTFMPSKITAIIIDKISPIELAGLGEQKANHLVTLN